MTAQTSQTRKLVADAPSPRLDRFLAVRCPDLTRSFLQKLIEKGCVLLNGKVSKGSQRVKRGDTILLTIPPPEAVSIEPEAMPLTVVYEDRDLLVVDKPPGLPVHPGPGHPRHTLVNALLAHCPDLTGIGGELRPGIVHRLDKDTSGLMVVAKNAKAHLLLSQQLKERAVTKTYTALVKGHLRPSKGKVDAPIARDPRNRKRMSVVAGGREAITEYEVVKYLGDYSLVELHPKTGRTHQLRVHMAHLGYPIVGDSLYGGRVSFLHRQFLHASALTFRLPPNGAVRRFTSSLPQDLAEVLKVLTTT